MVDSIPLEAGRIVAGRYRIEQRIGEGGMGAVYLVRHIHTDESLALKVLHAHVLRDENAVERFRREARAPARIANEHVARVTDADTAPDLDGAPFYVMELLRGRDLERVLTDDGPLSPVLVVEYLHQAARALDKAHAMGIVHRDLKPENLFLTERDDGTPCIKLVDFGIARLWDADAPAEMKTQAGFVFGTPAFLSPEQALGKAELVGPTTDVWAIGLLTFKLLTGKEFWGATSLAHLYAMILSEPIPTASSRGAAFGPAFDAWLAKCLTRDGAGRFPAVGQAVLALAEALGVRIDPIRRSNASLASLGSLVAAPPSGSGETWAAQGEAQQTRQSFGALPDAPAAPANDDLVRPPARRRMLPLLLALGAVAVVAAVVGITLGVRNKPTGLVGKAAASSTLPDASSGALAATSAESAAAASVPAEATAKIVPTPLAAADPRAGAAHEGSRTGAPSSRPGVARPAASDAPLTRDQRRRLETLQRLCDQGTFTPPECKTKRLAIMHGDP